MSTLLCVGNFGSGETEQDDISKLMCYICDKVKCKLVLGLGNNILPIGVSSVKDNQFLDKFEIPFMILPNNIKFYNILGNRDYYLKNSPRAQINYTQQSLRWIMPHNFYCFIKKFNNIPVEFLAIDTNFNKIKNKTLQERWAVNTLLESKARWRIVFGHHPWIHFDGNTKKMGSSNVDDFYKKLVDTNKVDLIISGHVNSQQHIFIPEKPNMIISGSSGGIPSASKNKPIQINSYDTVFNLDKILLAKELRFHSNEPGCVKIYINRNILNISFITTDKVVLYSFNIKKN